MNYISRFLTLVNLPSFSIKNRLIPLEATRGIAAIIVLVHHFCLAFIPLKKEAMEGRWYYVFFNGTGAVYFFFVLSGFVLCWSYFHTGNLNQLKAGLFKRWPRLAIPVLVTTGSSFLLFYFGLYFFSAASTISGSSWLATFANSGWKVDFHPSLYDAIIQGLNTFITGEASYNSNLWTMKPEFMGSIVVFLLGTFISLALSFKYLVIGFFLFAIWGLGIYNYLIPFIVGVFLSALCAKHKFKINISTALTLIIIGLYLMGFTSPKMSYVWVDLIAFPSLLEKNIQLVINSLGAGLVLFSLMANAKIYGLLNGKFCYYLGKFSFPLYLVHALVICSFSSWVYLQLHQAELSSKIMLMILFILTFLVSVLASIPLVFFDQFWLKQLNRLFSTKY